MVVAVQTALDEGRPLAEVLAKLKFTSVVVTQVALAEVHGQLALTLSIVSETLEMMSRQRQRLKQLMLYPVILLVLMLGLQVGVSVVILPSLGQAATIPIWPVGMIGGFGAVWCGWRILPVQRRLRIRLGSPIIGSIWRLFYQFEFLEGARLFIQAGQDLVTYGTYLATIPDLALQQVGHQISARLARGESLLNALKHPLVPEALLNLVTLGQSSERFTAAVKILTQQWFDRLQQKIERVIIWVQPVMFLGLGIQIVLTYLQVLAPMYQMMEVG
ncbi:type II secretory pathway competence component [Lacticaseibacillus brantae DSM 23927]|uniref:Type II secretory pathway competence component n=1 Tax=Lacticaseibacillus brantae DSM 23927 TaxID=1423727 RepID=A0A0R2B2T5_9LACO|nr:type II secretory pathway competence component [Lacticaseibacillus brantae DSM 23927]